MSESNEAGGKHYGEGLQPWDLQKHMQTWGNLFIDARRTDVIEYMFRTKGNSSKQLDDARKAKHNCEVIIKHLKDLENQDMQLELGEQFTEKTNCPIEHKLKNLKYINYDFQDGACCMVCGADWPKDEMPNIKRYVGDNLIIFHPTHRVINEVCIYCEYTSLQSLANPCPNNPNIDIHKSVDPKHYENNTNPDIG